MVEPVQPETSRSPGATTPETLAILDLGREAIIAFGRQTQANLEAANKQVELQREQLRLYDGFVSKLYWLVFAVVMFIMATAAGVIFYLRELQTGLAVLGLTGTVATTFLAGLGWKARK